jgi:uncharacterized protein
MVFLDANVLVSDFATRDLCADVIRLVLAELELIVGEVVLGNLSESLSRGSSFQFDQIREILAFLEGQTIQPKPKSPFTPPIRDENDQWVLSSALAAKAEVLVTGDEDLLDVSDQVGELTIVDPRGFWNLVEEWPRK